MNISMGFACGDDFDTKESKAPLTDEQSTEARQRIGMDWHHLGVEGDKEFWPVEHPLKPPDEDGPVKCPIPDSTVINDGGMNEKRFSENMWKITEQPIVVEGQSMVVADAEPPIRAVRKRHHTLTRGDHIITPLMRMPPLPPLPTHNISIFQMLQQLDKIES
ncbi:uncharacterized protein LOC132179949 [Corylus avellana]|uniref:uncharacterized protein LOC132179949 n=1 Tax=Corylus avellana TaxID=13451 RepID=UPI00286C71B4|nr:uncharacterized protein LOC132179949 [Corylus avellana]